MIIGAIPNRDAMSPPQLAADTPILDVFHPVVISLLEVFGYDLNATVLHGIKRGFCQRINRHEPLLRDHRLDNFSAALRAWDGGRIRLGLDDETGGFHISPEIFTRVESILTLIFCSAFVDLCLAIKP